MNFGLGKRLTNLPALLAELTGPGPAPLRKAASIYQAAIDNLTHQAGIAA